MTSPVDRAMRNLTQAIINKPEPTPVTIVPAKLKGSTEVIRLWLAIAITLQFRTLVVWGFLALFFPQLGVTWLMVMFGLYALRHAAPLDLQRVIDVIAGQRK